MKREAKRRFWDTRHLQLAARRLFRAER